MKQYRSAFVARPCIASLRCALPLALFAMAVAAPPALADPLAPPTVPYIADVEITRPTDFAVNFPARYIYNGPRARVDYGPVSTIVEFDRRVVTVMMPRVRTYWRPERIADPLADARRWIGVEARTAESAGTEVMLGHEVTRYHVHGTMFDTKLPFDGDVWATDENIVLKVSGTSQDGNIAAPVALRTVQLIVGPPDPSLLGVPRTFARAPARDVSWRDGD